ncbi:MAG: hypothetical protein PHP62_03810, partial [Candidatus Moranbacteria bacterium]|nr:hypothetical protein [Candidatus Moranbacteria bacterium]
TSIVMVSTGSSVDKSKTASAITTMSSLLPELVTCADDSGVGIISGAPTAGTTPVCCATSACAAAMTGHNVTWPNINTKTGYTYGAPTGTLAAGTYQFTATKSGQPTITCSYANNGCSTP